jgi:uncharacterized protein YkwD
MLALVNQARRSAGARPLQYSNDLEAAAMRHSKDIARTGQQGHIGEHTGRLLLLLVGMCRVYGSSACTDQQLGAYAFFAQHGHVIQQLVRS